MDNAILNNRYRLDLELGHGGMGVVYRGHDLLLQRDVAVKVLNNAGLGTEGRARLLREAQAVARLNHPNIITVYDAGEADGAPYIVMELLQGRSLFERRPQNLDELLEIGQQVCAALEHAHSHDIIHRDLKPENVIVSGAMSVPRATGAGAEPMSAEKGDLRVRLTDFGLARSQASRVTTEGGIVGTVFYLSPEQALGKDLDGRADLYALGVMLYELTAGRLPYGGDDPLTIISQHLHAPAVPPTTYNPDTPPALEALILKLMSKRPEDRPASAAEVGRTLERIARKSTELLTLLEDAPELSPLDRLVRGRLVGRDRELAEAKAIWQRATVEPDSETPHMLLISGEAGVGKTPLVRAIRALAEVSRGRVLSAQCYAEVCCTPYAPVAQLIRDALAQAPVVQVVHNALAEPAPTLELPELVLADLTRLAPDLRARYPNLPENPPLSPQAEQQRLFESVVLACAELIDHGRMTAQGPAGAPLLLVIEDVQWSDDGTLALLRHLARRGRAIPLKLLLVLTYREAELDETRSFREVLFDFTRERLATRIKLGRFDRDQTAALLGVMFQQEIPAAFVEGIYRETEGNLFFIEEVCKALIEEGKLHRSGGQWHFPEEMRHVEIPQSVRLTIGARVAKLPPATQDVLRLAAVIGREFDFDTLHRACELDEDALIEALETAQSAQLIAEVRGNGNGQGKQRDAFAFAHNLTVATLRESVSGLRRRRLHRRVAEAIEALNPDDDASLSYHYHQAGDDAHARTHYRNAGDRARRVYANEVAIQAYSEALALTPDASPQRFDLLLARAQTYDLVGRRAEQQSDIEAMLALAEKLDDDARRCDALLAQADFYLDTDHLRAKEPAQRGVEIARRIGDGVREGHALRRLGFAARLRGDAATSRNALEAAVDLFRAAGQPAEAATCLHYLSLALGDLGENDAALVAGTEAVALSLQAGDRRQEGISLRRVAIAYYEQRRFAEALPPGEAALALLRAVGDRAEECNTLNALGVLHAWIGHPIESEAYLRAALELSEAASSTTGAIFAIENLLVLHYGWRGEYAAGIAFLEAQLRMSYLAASEYISSELRVLRADFLSRLGQYSRALAIMRDEILLADRRLAQGTISAVGHVHILSFVGRVEAELGDHDAARAHLEAALARHEQAETPSDAAELMVNRAYGVLLRPRTGTGVRLAADEAELRHGLDLMRRAIELLCKGAAWMVDLARAHRMAAELSLALGQPDAALADSAAALRAMGAVPYEAEAFLFTHSRALEAAGREAEAEEYLRRAYHRVLLVASRTEDAELQRSWLEDVRTNREIVARWERLNQTA